MPAKNIQPAASLNQRAVPEINPLPRLGLLKEKFLKYRVGIGLAFIVAGAGLMRLLVLYLAKFVGDGDEALIGLMAKHITEGKPVTFTYGLPYMAATESYFIAPLYLFFGVSEAGMKMAPLAASTGLVVLNFWVARYFFSSKMAGIFAALLTAFPPLYLTVTGLRAWGNFIETLLLGDGLFLLAYFIVFERQSWKPWKLWLVFGLVSGYSFYGYWLVAFYFLPVYFFIFLKDRLFFLRRDFFLFFLPAFFAGSLPFWIWNFRHNWGTYHFFFDPPKGGNGGKPPALEVLNFFVSTSLRLADGSFNYWFAVSLPFAVGLNLIYGGTLLGWLAARRKGLAGLGRLSLERAKPVDLLLLFVLLAPILYTASGVGTNAFTLPGVDTTGRYLLPLMGAAPVLLGGFIQALISSPLPAFFYRLNFPASPSRLFLKLAGISLLLVLLFSNLYLYRWADFVRVFQSPYLMALRPPEDNRPVVEYIKGEGVEYFTCNHWVGNRLMLNSAEAVKCVDYYDLQQGGLERFPQLTACLLEPGRKIGFLLINPTGGKVPLDDRLTELGVTYTRKDFSPYSVFIPRSRAVPPPEVVEALRYPY